MFFIQKYLKQQQMLRIILLVVFIVVSIFSFAQEAEIEDLTIEFNNLSKNQGFVMIQVEDPEKRVASQVVIPVTNHAAKTTIKLAKGTYGVSAYHDINANKKLDFSLVGIPQEPYGFSNNARGTFGKPPFEETLINLTSSKQISFKLQ